MTLTQSWLIVGAPCAPQVNQHWVNVGPIYNSKGEVLLGNGVGEGDLRGVCWSGDISSV